MANPKWMQRITPRGVILKSSDGNGPSCAFREYILPSQKRVFSAPPHTSSCLRIHDDGTVTMNGGGGANAQFTVSRVEGSEEVRLNCSANGLALAVHSGGFIGVKEDEANLYHTRFFLEESDASLSSIFEHHSLSPQQLQSFADDGYLIIRGLVPASVVAQAKRRIISELLQEGAGCRKLDDICPVARRHQDVMALLYKSPIWTLV
jgi:hypothetical protein